jgi:hypothetical protein
MGDHIPRRYTNKQLLWFIRLHQNSKCPHASLPTWSSTLLQSSVSLSDFGGQVNWNNQVSNRPTFDWDTLLNKPSWVLPSQSNVALSAFSVNIDASRVNNLPTSDTADREYVSE